MKLPIYMDNHATTPMDPRVLEAMMPYFTDISATRQPQPQLRLGSGRSRGESAQADRGPDRRDRRKRSFSPAAPPNRTTSRSRASPQMYAEKGNHIITAATEHKAILDTCKHLEKKAAASPICRCRRTG